jgi:hypothetical protein
MTIQSILDWMINAGIWACMGAFVGGLIVFGIMTRNVQRAAQGAFNIPPEYVRNHNVYGNDADRVRLQRPEPQLDRMPWPYAEAHPVPFPSASDVTYTAADMLHAAYCEMLLPDVHDHRCPQYEPPTVPEPVEQEDNAS